jgi:tetratricopeptide (TPR) repeat protein
MTEAIVKTGKIAIFLISLSVPFFSGCMPLALKMSSSLFPNFVASVFEECDPELAKGSFPANLKLMEGLLKNAPKNRDVLITLSMGFSGYSMLFVERDDPARASALYLRARDYGIRALGDKGAVLKNPRLRGKMLQTALQNMSKEDLKPLFWTTMSWNAWINLNLDKPAALAQLTLSQACLERVMEIDANYLYGLPYILMGASLAAMPPMLGGNIQEAKDYFEKALRLSNRKFFLTQYYFAKFYTVRVQDKELFLKLIQEIIDGDPHELKDVCLINGVVQNQAGQLRETVEDLFF